MLCSTWRGLVDGAVCEAHGVCGGHTVVPRRSRCPRFAACFATGPNCRPRRHALHNFTALKNSATAFAVAPLAARNALLARRSRMWAARRRTFLRAGSRGSTPAYMIEKETMATRHLVKLVTPLTADNFLLPDGRALSEPSLPVVRFARNVITGCHCAQAPARWRLAELVAFNSPSSSPLLLDL